MANGTGNKEYRSDVFSMLLQDKRRALEIYNAMNGTAYDDPEQVEITTLEDRSFSLTIRNDASFVLDHHLSIYEHQSTYCPNMPLRDMIYFASMMQKKVYAKRRDLYARTLLRIPVPHFAVFYNGKESVPEQYELRLSDAFEQKTDAPELELVCKVYNINKGQNTELLAKCPTLRDYMYFIDAVREYHAENDFTDLEGAIEQAISRCIRENVLKEFLIEHRTEVTHMMTMDYTFERRLEFQCEEATEKGMAKGREEGRKEGMVEGCKEGMQKKLHDQIQKKLLKRKSLEQIAEELEEDPDELRPLYEQMKEELCKA